MRTFGKLYSIDQKRATVEKLKACRNVALPALPRCHVQVLAPIGETIQPFVECPILERDRLSSFVVQQGGPGVAGTARTTPSHRRAGHRRPDRWDHSEALVGGTTSVPKACHPRQRLLTVIGAHFSKGHRAVGKETGAPASGERFNNTVRQRCANLVHKTVSFSNDDHRHKTRFRLLIDLSNRQLECTRCLASGEIEPRPPSPCLPVSFKRLSVMSIVPSRVPLCSLLRVARVSIR